MADFRRIGILGIVFLVILRVGVGWQLLYEGLWKLNTQGTPDPWTAEPYLKNAQGPLREHFRSLTGDPYDLNWIDYDTVLARWEAWADRFADHYELSEARRNSLNDILHGRKEFRADLDALPQVVLDKMIKKETKDGEKLVFPKSLDKYIWYEEDNKRLVVDGKGHLTRGDLQKLIELADVKSIEEAEEANKGVDTNPTIAYLQALKKVYDQSKRLSIKERLMVTLKGDPERAGGEWKVKGEVLEARPGEIELYRNYLEKYGMEEDTANTNYEFDHLGYHWKKVQELKSNLVGPVKALQEELEWSASRMLTTEQLAKGPVPQPLTDQRFVDLATMWGLTIIGLLLIGGLLTRVAALAGAGLLLQFYLAYPPLPGYPDPPGTGHNIVVNQTFVEVLVLACFVFLPSGRWFGIDGLIASLFGMFSKPKTA